MNKAKIIVYMLIMMGYFVVLHMILPPWFSSSIRTGITNLFTDFLKNWTFIFPLIGLFFVLVLPISYYGINLLASFEPTYKVKDFWEPKISIMIASKNELPLLKRTLTSIIKSNYPKKSMQIVIVTSGSTDGSADFCKKFANENSDIDWKVIDKEIPKKGKPQIGRAHV